MFNKLLIMTTILLSITNTQPKENNKGICMEYNFIQGMQEAYNEIRDIENNIINEDIITSRSNLKAVKDFDNNKLKERKEEVNKKIDEEKEKRIKIRKEKEAERLKEEERKKQEELKKQEEQRKKEEELKKQEEERKRKEDEIKAQQQPQRQPLTITIQGKTFNVINGNQYELDTRPDAITVITYDNSPNNKYKNKEHGDGTSWYAALHDYNGGNLLWNATSLTYTDINGVTKTYYLEYTSKLLSYGEMTELYQYDLSDGYVPNRIAIQTCQGYGNGTHRYYVFREEGETEGVSYYSDNKICDDGIGICAKY